MSAIPASAIVSVSPGVLSAGGTALALSGLLLTNSTQAPVGTVLSFANADDVGVYFGASSDEASLAGKYFLGYDNSLVKPGALLFTQYPAANVGAYLRSGALTGISLADIQALNGTIIVTIDGSVFTTGTINLSSSTSFSSAALLIQGALQAALPAAASVTGSVGGTFTASAGATFTGTGTSTSLVVTSVTGVIHPGCTISGTGVPAGTTILSQSSGTTGAAGTYITSGATTASTASITATSNVLDLTAVSTGTMQTTDVLSGSGVTSSPSILAQLSGAAGGVGAYIMSSNQQFASTTVTSLSTVLKVTVVGSGSLGINSPISGSNIVSGTTITAFITGSGGVGTYRISAATTAASTTITANVANPTCVYDSVANAFKIISGATGTSSTIGYATGTLATPLLFTLATGATLSQGAPAGVPATNMAAVIAQTQNFASFATVFKPSVDDMVAFAAWTNAQGNRFLYSMWDDDASVDAGSAPSSAGAQIKAADYSGTVAIFDPENEGLAAELMGYVASVDFNSPNARATMAFRSQSGTLPTATSQTATGYLTTNGYNWYGAYATANDEFNFFYPGSVSGPFLWIDTYINQIWLNNNLQLALMTLLVNSPSIPYNPAGYTMIEAACADPINSALTFGAIRGGIPLSASQRASVNQAAGLDIAGTISQRGWYLSVRPATAEVRTARGSPPITLWYTDGGSVQSINLASIVIQ